MEEIQELKDDVISVFKQFKHTLNDAIAKKKAQEPWCIEVFCLIYF